MPDWKAAPIFGAPDPQLPCIVRPSVYALICDAAGRLAIVRTGSGAYLLGGGIEGTESPEDAVCRETREECGLTIVPGSWRRAAIDHITVPGEGAHFEKRSVFCDAAVVALAFDSIEIDHTLIWLPPHDALAALTPLGHRWAVTEWMNDRSTTPPSRPALQRS